MTVDEMLERAFDLRGTPPNTRRTYTYCVHHFERFVGGPITELGRQQVEQFPLHLVRERRLGASSHNVYAAALRFLYDAALDRPEVTYRFVRQYVERETAPRAALKQIDPLIRDLTHYRDLIANITKEPS